MKHPARDGAFLFASSDGASYHSGRSSRDRDRLRLENPRKSWLDNPLRLVYRLVRAGTLCL